MKNIPFLILILFFALTACRNTDKAEGQKNTSSGNALPVKLNSTGKIDKLSDYWYQGKAEISRYELSQNRYKDIHPGEVVMIFVTEDFLTDKQVKNDHYTNPNSIPILKNNIVKHFPTGIYTYNIMTSVFTPVNTDEHLLTLKVSNSSQEWCGQTYMQINYNGKQKAYDYQLHSYFENEADEEGQVKATLLEEELFNRIRINPKALPTGTMQILPSAEYSRLAHRPYGVEMAETSLAEYTGDDFEGENLAAYTIHYPKMERTVEIVFEIASPYLIAGWRDTYPSRFDRQPRTTLAKRTHTIIDDYWSHNALEDMGKRAELGLD